MIDERRPRDLERILATEDGGRILANLLNVEAHLQFRTEAELQANLSDFLDEYLVYPAREVVLSDGRSRIDMLAGTVGIEVKIDGSWASVIRQLTRYAKCTDVGSLVLVTSRAKHHHLPDQLAGKPLHLVSLVGANL